MNSKKLAAAATGLALLTAACENLTPGENAGVFGAAAGIATGVPLAAAGVDPAITIPVTAGAVAVTAVTAYIISKNQATERQRKIAEQRARLYMARREKQLASQPAAKKAKPARFIAVQTERAETAQGKASVMVFDTQTRESRTDGKIRHLLRPIRRNRKLIFVSAFYCDEIVTNRFWNPSRARG